MSAAQRQVLHHGEMTAAEFREEGCGFKTFLRRPDAGRIPPRSISCTPMASPMEVAGSL
jgi:hypothetical protein